MTSTSRRLHPLVIEAQAKPEDKAAANALAAAVREILVRSGRFHGLGLEDAEDNAQAKVLQVCAALAAGAVEAGCEEGYVWKAGAHASDDEFRKRGRRAQGLKNLASAHETGTAGGAVPVEDAPLGSESAREQVLGLLRSDKMPKAYRRVLEEVHVNGRTISDLADEEHKAQPLNPKSGVPRTLEQARNTVDARLSRARRWLEAHLAAQKPKGVVH